MKDDLTVLLYDHEIKKKVVELAEMISADYKDSPLFIIGVLRAAWIFTADLVRAIPYPVHCDFVRAGSYRSTESSGKVDLFWDVKRSQIEGKEILLVDTVLDTGRTMNFIINHLREMNPASIELCILVDKKGRREIEVPVKYKGFDAPDTFLVGYGLDGDDRYRNVPHIAEINKDD